MAAAAVHPHAFLQPAVLAVPASMEHSGIQCSWESEDLQADDLWLVTELRLNKQDRITIVSGDENKRSTAKTHGQGVQRKEQKNVGKDPIPEVELDQSDAGRNKASAGPCPGCQGGTWVD